MKTPSHEPKGLIDKGFGLDKRVNRALIAGGLGVAAVGAVIAAPAVATFGAVVAGGSIAGLEITKRFEHSYRNYQEKKLGQKATQISYNLAT